MEESTETPRQRLFLAIVGLALGILLVAAVASGLLREHASPAQVLPAASTKALLQGNEPSQRAVVTVLYPILQSAPKLGSGMSLAVLSNGNRTGWVVLYAPTASHTHDTKSGKWTQAGAFDVLLSDASLAPLLTEKTDRLSVLPSFRNISSKMRKTQAWSFFNLAPLPAASADELLQYAVSLTKGARFAAMATAGKTQTFILDGASDWPSWPPAPRTYFSAGTGADLILSLSDPLKQTASLLQALPQDRRLVLEGLLLHQLQTLLGTDVSVPSDISPLLNRHTTLAVRLMGHPALLLAGSLDDASTAKTLLASLHAKAAAQMPAMALVSRSLDRDFGSTLLKSDPSVVLHTVETIDGWTVETTRNTQDGRAISTGMYGHRFVLSTDPAWLLRSVQKESQQTAEHIVFPEPAVETSSFPVATGLLDPLALPFILDALPVLPLSGPLPALLGLGKGPVLWSLHQAGTLRMLTIEIP